MTIGPRTRAVEAPSHWGFRADGSAYSSPIPEGGQCTNFVRHLLDRVRHEFMSPAQLVEVIALQRPELRTMFTFASMDNWSKLNRYWQWPLAMACGSAEITVKFHGKRVPPWDTDERAWNQRVVRACEVRMEPLPHETVYIDGIDHPILEGETYAQAARRVAGSLGEVVDRLAGE